MAQTFTRVPSKDRKQNHHEAAAVKNRTFEAQDTSSAGTGQPRDRDVFTRARQMQAREERRIRELKEKETAEAAPEETQAADTKPAARKRTAAKTTDAPESTVKEDSK